MYGLIYKNDYNNIAILRKHFIRLFYLKKSEFIVYGVYESAAPYFMYGEYEMHLRDNLSQNKCISIMNVYGEYIVNL